MCLSHSHIQFRAYCSLHIGGRLVTGYPVKSSLSVSLPLVTTTICLPGKRLALQGLMICDRRVGHVCIHLQRCFSKVVLGGVPQWFVSSIAVVSYRTKRLEGPRLPKCQKSLTFPQNMWSCFAPFCLAAVTLSVPPSQLVPVTLGFPLLSPRLSCYPSRSLSLIWRSLQKTGGSLPVKNSLFLSPCLSWATDEAWRGWRRSRMKW